MPKTDAKRIPMNDAVRSSFKNDIKGVRVGLIRLMAKASRNATIVPPRKVCR